MRIRFLAFAALAATVPAVPADAHHRTVTVTLDVSLGTDDVDHAGCSVVIPHEADGFDVLDAAVRAEDCIESYEAFDSGSYGRFLNCIDDICGQSAPTWALPAPVAYVGTTWTFTVDDDYVSYGLETYEAVQGDEIGLTYTHYAFAA